MSTLDQALDFIKSLTADPLLDGDNKLMASVDIAAHARIELASIRKQIAHDAGEPAAWESTVAWESITGAYKRFITDKQYEGFSPAARRWYKPYRCSSCASPQPAQAGKALHPLEIYADSYAQMARMDDGKVDCRSVEVDIRQNMIPVTQALSSPDYFGSLVESARQAATQASAKFPQPNYVTLKIAEEAGEVVRGAVHYAEGRMPWSEVEGEIVQLLAMLIRFVTEGDQISGVTPPVSSTGDMS